MKVVLAPMDGLTDPLMRQILTSIGGYDWCVSEFVRVTHTLHGKGVFERYCPEMHTGWKTLSGTPVHLQLLGSDPACMADNAAKVAGFGAPAVDLNFGCPAKTVNKHRGGAALLGEPDLIYNIVSSVRLAVPTHIPVSVKIRLGFECSTQGFEVAKAAEAAGAGWLTVHARTKTQGYKPPAYWELVQPISEALSIPVIINGEVWTPEQAQLALKRSGCKHLMLGRGAVARPDLANKLKGGAELSYEQLLPFFEQFLTAQTSSEKGLVGRFKQWYGLLSRGYEEAQLGWGDVKGSKQPAELIKLLSQS